MGITEQVARRAGRCGRADAGALSGRAGLHRARRRARLLRGLRHRRADDPVLPDVDAGALARLEDADPLPRPSPPRGRLRPARQRQERPARDRRGLRRVGVRPGRDRRPGRDAGPSGRSSSASRSGAPAQRCCSPPSTPNACSALVFIGPCVPGELGADAACAAAVLSHPGCAAVPAQAADDARLGEVQRRPPAPRLPRLRRVVRRARQRASAHSTKAYRRHRRLGPRDRPGDADPHRPGRRTPRRSRAATSSRWPAASSARCW